LGGNISLGLMLGIIPSVAVFFGLPLDVRQARSPPGK
jgi:site-specific recombinase